MRAKKAFSLIELLVVVGIISLLVSMLLPSLSQAKELSQKTVCQVNLGNILKAIETYRCNYNDVYPARQDPVSTSPFYWTWMGRGMRDVLADELSMQAGAINSHSVMLCPADPAAKTTYDATSYAYSMSFYHSPAQINMMTDKTYCYTNQTQYPAIAQNGNALAHPGQKIIAGEWNGNHDDFASDNGWWSDYGSRNFIFADGSVRFLRADEIHPANDGYPDPNLTTDGISGQDID